MIIGLVGSLLSFVSNFHFKYLFNFVIVNIKEFLFFLETYSPTNSWAYLSPILNFMKYDCNSTNCSSDNRKLFEDNFNFLPELMYKGIDKIVDTFIDSDNVSTLTDPIILTNLIISNVTSISQMKDRLMADFFKYQNHRDFLDKYIPETFNSSWTFRVVSLCFLSFFLLSQLITFGFFIFLIHLLIFLGLLSRC